MTPARLCRRLGDQLVEADIADLIAYLDTLPPGPRNFGPQAGEGPMGNEGMDATTRDMDDARHDGRRPVLLWVVVVVFAAAWPG